MRLERRRGQLLIEQLIGIVLAALQLRDDDRALGLAVVGMVQAVRHALGLDEQHAIERVAASPSRDTSSDRSRCSRSSCRRYCSMMPFTWSRGMLVVPLKFMCSTQCDTPVRPGRSSFEPDLYQHHTDASGAVCSSWTSTFRPLSSVACAASDHYKIDGYPCPSGKTPSTCRAPTSR